MRKAPTALSFAPDLPFKYVGGDPCLDLVNTVDWTRQGLANDRLADYARLTRWAEGAGLVSRREAERLRREEEARPREAQAAYEAALWHRQVLQRLFASIAAGERPGAALDDFNDLLAEALRRLRVSPIAKTGRARVVQSPVAWEWQGRDDDLGSLLWPVVWSAAHLLTSLEARRVRVCASTDCGWIYVDRSRNRLRRWCEMETCGTMEKSRRRSERRRGIPLDNAG
jgi:predicted RNA-binding Zn ribbon-like protein